MEPFGKTNRQAVLWPYVMLAMLSHNKKVYSGRIFLKCEILASADWFHCLAPLFGAKKTLFILIFLLFYYHSLSWISCGGETDSVDRSWCYYWDCVDWFVVVNHLENRRHWLRKKNSISIKKTLYGVSFFTKNSVKGSSRIPCIIL